MGLRFFLEDHLGRKVDLVTPDALKPRKRPVIEREAVDVAEPPGLAALGRRHHRVLRKIGRLLKAMTCEAFVADERSRDAVIRNIEVIGEAAENLPDGVIARAPRWGGGRSGACAT